VVRSLTLDPSGRLLVALGQEGRAPGGRVWDLPGGKELARLPRAFQVAFSPDGGTAAVAVGGSHWDVGGGFGKRKEKRKETPDRVRVIPVAELRKGVAE
jgi:hypothetical protein